MYTLLLILHNLLRWAVVLGALWALFATWRGFITKGVWQKSDQQAGFAFSTALNVQFLVGLILYFVSPVVQGWLGNMETTMSDDTARFFVAEHPVQMLLAVIIAQVGYSVSKRKSTDRTKFLWAAVAYTLAAVIIAVAIPWDRPMIRF